MPIADPSSADRLPEADSLPDGFVDSPEVDNAAAADAAADYKDLPVDPHAGAVDIGSAHVGMWPPAEVDQRSGGSKDSVEAIRLPVLADDGCLGVAVDVKEKGHSHGKDSSLEVKRKSTKRALKAEKDLFDLTLKYQQILSERDGAIAVREKLESLCRELQRQNKMLMDECKRVSTDGQNLRLELSTKFQDAIKDISHKLEEQKADSLLQLKENETLRDQLKHLSDQYTLSEQQFQQKLKQKLLELQLSDLKLKQQEEKSANEQGQMKLYAEQVSALLETEKSLRVQLAADGERFQQFQDALVKSNEVFESFKQEMEKMAKSMKELKKENDFLKSKCDKTDVSLIELLEEREYLKKQLDKVKIKKEKLESLCRSLQAERKQQLSGVTDACTNLEQLSL